MQKPSLSHVDRFLALKRLALVGVSRNPRDFSRGLFRELTHRRYDVVPVNPGMETTEGFRCYRSVRAISPPVEGALVMVPKSAIEDVLRDCAEAGVLRVWLYGLKGPREFDASIIDLVQQLNIEVIAGYCPYMFFPKTQFFHRLHGGFMKVMGTYPGRHEHHIG